MRKPFIAGNWKMNLNIQQADSLAMALKSSLIDNTNVDIAVAPTYLTIPAVVSRLKQTNISVAAQNLHTAQSGAFTGELSSEMLRSAGCSYVLVGHSERRQYFGETDESVNQRTHAAFRGGLLPIVCIGEHLAQRQAGVAEQVVGNQLRTALNGLTADQVAAVTIAYEPVWAIGTGVTASPEQAQEIHRFLRSCLEHDYPAYVAKQVRIQYGGSVKPNNAAALLSQPDIDGALVGGASLKAESFAAIINAA